MHTGICIGHGRWNAGFVKCTQGVGFVRLEKQGTRNAKPLHLGSGRIYFLFCLSHVTLFPLRVSGGPICHQSLRISFVIVTRFLILLSNTFAIIGLSITDLGRSDVSIESCRLHTE